MVPYHFKYGKKNMFDDITLSISGILAIVIIEMICRGLVYLIDYNIRDNCVLYATLVIVMGKTIYHSYRLIKKKIIKTTKKDNAR